MTKERLGWWETRGGEDRGEGDEAVGRLVVCFIEALARAPGTLTVDSTACS